MNRFSKSFSSKRNRSLRGKLLVATETLDGSPFERSVILLLQDHEKAGTFGVILNRPADDSMLESWQQISGSPLHVASQVVDGGPVGGPVFAIHKYAELGEMEISGPIFITADTGSIQQLFDYDPEGYRIFLGIAGWKPDQLVSEIDQGSWLVLDSEPEDVFDDSTWLWEKSMFRYSEQIICDVIGISINDLPLDPNLN